jgi:hypothetical protein
MDMSKSAFVPNSFQTPNGYVDLVMSYLTGEEYKVLIYATRRILGFQKRQDRISISQFTDGTKKENEILDKGTGLGIGTVKKCLKSLSEFGLMVKVADNDPKTNEGAMWSLQWDGNKVNWQALEERHAKKQEVEKKRISKARSVRQTGVSGTDRPPASRTTRPPASGTETQKPVETQRNTVKQSLELFKGYFGKFLSVKEAKRWEVVYEIVGNDTAEELAAWAFRKEIHMMNRSGLIDSLETAAKKWHVKTEKPVDTAPHPEYLPVPQEDKSQYVQRPANIPRPNIRPAAITGD